MRTSSTPGSIPEELQAAPQSSSRVHADCPSSIRGCGPTWRRGRPTLVWWHWMVRSSSLEWLSLEAVAITTAIGLNTRLARWWQIRQSAALAQRARSRCSTSDRKSTPHPASADHQIPCHNAPTPQATSSGATALGRSGRHESSVVEITTSGPYRTAFTPLQAA